MTSADDAFGTAVGLQNVGLYSETDARGFNPQQAGNLRIEGLYFDQQTWVTSRGPFDTVTVLPEQGRRFALSLAMDL